MIFEVRSIRSPGWYWVRRELLTEYASVIGPTGIAVYSVLAMCADNTTQKAFPGIEYIAQCSGCSTRQVQRKIKQLDELGLVAVHHTTTKTGASGPNVYWLLPITEGDSVSPYPDIESPDGDSVAHELDPCNYIWSQVLIELEMHMTKGAFARWLSGSRVTENGGDTFTVKVRDEPAVQWLSGRWQDIIDEKLSAVAGRDVSVAFRGPGESPGEC